MSSPTPAFSLTLLGGCSLARGDGLVAGRVAQRRRLACLALIAAAGRKGMSRDKLAAYLWPEHGDERARHLLSDTLYVLRSAFGEEAVLTPGDLVALNSALVACDLVAFEAAVERGDAADAVAAYGGPFLDGFHVSDAPEFERWVDAERDRIGGVYAAMLETLSQNAEQRGDFREAAEWLRRLSVLRPYDGHTTRRLAEALDAAGDRAGAIRQLEVHATLLRQDLETEPDPALLQLAERLRLARPPRLPHTTGSPGSPLLPNGAPVALPTTRARLHPAYLVIGVVALVGVVASYWRGASRPSSIAASTVAPAIAVLPFKDLSASRDREYFSDGISDAIVDALARLPTVHVAARSSSFSFKGKNTRADEVGRALNVRYLVEGSVQWEGERVRVRAQLVDVQTGYGIWSNRYERQVRQIFDLEDEIARAVTDALSPTLAARRRRAAGSRTELDVYEPYLKARSLWGQGEYAKAIPLFQAALAGDSTYAPAYAGLADSYARLEDTGMIPREEAYAKATAAAQSALRLDESSAEAHTALAHILMHRRHWMEADAEFRRALELNPSYATGHAFYAVYLAGTRHPDSAVSHARRARMLDPLGAETALLCAAALRNARHSEESLATLRTLLDLNPTFPLLHLQLGVTYVDLGRYSEAIAELTLHSRTTRNSRARVHLARALALSGAKAAARDTLQAILRAVPERELQAVPVAAAFAALGDRDRAFQWLEKLADTGQSQLFTLYGAIGDDLRGDPRFPLLMRRLGMER